jgi:RHS repeat-associated protein
LAEQWFLSGAEGQNSTSYHSPFKFSAKEKDIEMPSIREDQKKTSTPEQTGYSYFGARYYSPELSVWLSVDPMTDKYPSWSAYAYCFASPQRFRDYWGLEGVDQKEANSGKAKNGATYTDKSSNNFVKQDGVWMSQLLLGEAQTRQAAEPNGNAKEGGWKLCSRRREY